MEGKKISFGFRKTKKVERAVVEEKKDFIECVEEKAIKVVGGDEVKENAPLIIPMKPNTLVTSERLKEIAMKVESAIEEPEKPEEPPPQKDIIPENETLEQMAVRELLEDSKKVVKVETPELKLLLPVKSVTGGEKESTLDDYESVPIQEFGLAMLRGMGWTKTNDKSTFKQPQLRPKGLGLGADKVVKDNQKQKSTKDNRGEELAIVKNAYVKITSGKYSGYYGKVLSLDEDNGRVLVEIEVKKVTTSLSEFMMVPVSKSEYTKESKVINANSFEQYKKGEMVQKSSNNLDKERLSRNSERNKEEEDKPRHQREGNSGRQNNNDRQNERGNSDYRERNRDRSERDKHRDSSKERSSQVRNPSRKTNNKYSSNESLSSNSDSDRKRHKKKKQRSKRDSSAESLNFLSDTERKKKKERRRRDSDYETEQKSKSVKERKRESSDSDSDHGRNKRNDTPDGKRDIDKKRKGKKKKRDRDRSPNYRKHRK